MSCVHNPLEMDLINNIVTKIILGAEDYCSLCFRSTREDAICVQDHVIIDEETQKSMAMSELLHFTLNENVLANLMSLNMVCNECKQVAVTSYNFIKMCEENSESLTKSIESVTDCLTNVKVENINMYNSVYVLLGTDNIKCQQYYDKEQPVSLKSAAKIFNTLYNENCLSKRETFLPQIGLRNAKQSSNKRSINLHDIPSIKDSEIILSVDESEKKCIECFKSFQDMKNLRKHYFRLHYPRKFKCSKCPRRFISDEILQHHFQESHSAVECTQCGKVFTNKYVLFKHEINHNVLVVCQDCGRVYRSKEAFKKHITDAVCQQKKRKTAEQGIYYCDHCNKRYCYKPYLAKHIKHEHENAEGFKCEVCNKKFYTPSLLRIHMFKHTQEKNFECTQCGGRFVTKTSLLYHTRLHTGERPYKCEYCDKAFLSASRRLDHTRRHHLPPTLECDICHQKFKVTPSLLKHRRRHFNPNSRLNISRNIVIPVGNSCIL